MKLHDIIVVDNAIETDLANYFEQDNKAFNKNKFLNACINNKND